MHPKNLIPFRKSFFEKNLIFLDINEAEDW